MVSGAIAAWEKGATGAGIKIAIIDSGINAALPDFAGRIDPASADTAGNRGVTDEDGHGTAVASVAAAARNDNATVGIAFNSTILAYRTDEPGTCAMTGKDEGCKHNDTDISEAIDLARVAGAKVINMSLGGSAPSTAVINAVNRATAAGIIVVVSGGNDGRDPTKAANADPFALVLAQRNGDGLVLIAGSIGFDIDGSSETRTDIDLTKLSAFSNQAGAGAAYYLAALGLRVVAPNVADENKLYLFSGTSFSAPVISGAVALIAQAFPNLTGRQIVDLLFRTATDLGDAGDDAVFGQGALNLARAFSPQGQTALAGTGAPISLYANGGLPGAAGDAKTGKIEAVILDEYQRAFSVDLASTLRTPQASRPLQQALGSNLQSAYASAGPIAVDLTVSRRRFAPTGVGLAQLGLSYEDSRQARLVAGSAIGRISNKTAIAMGFSEGAKALEKRLGGIGDAPFMIARDPHSTPGFEARRGDALAVRHQLGAVGLTLSGERGRIEEERRLFPQSSVFSSGTLTADGKVGPVRLSLGASRMREGSTVLGGRFDAALGAPGATSWFVDSAAQMGIGGGWIAGARYRRGWTGFGSEGSGTLATDAFSFDLAKLGLLKAGDRMGLRVSQPLRVRSGGLGVLLPVSYSYQTLQTEYAVTEFNLAPEGRELDFEAAYSLPLWGGQMGANAFLRRQPGHIAAAKDDIGAAIQFTLGF